MAHPEKFKKILVFTLSNIGDVILNTPVISLLRQRFPDSFIAVLVGPKGEPIFSGSRMINEVIIYDKRMSWFQKLKLVFELRQKRFDLVVDLRNSAMPFLLGARHHTSYFVDRSSISMRDQHLNRIRFLFPDQNAKNQFDFFSPAEKNTALKQLESKLPNVNGNNLVILAPGAGGALKRWTLPGFTEVMNHYLAKGKTIALLGWDLERDLGAVLEQNASRPVANLIGTLNLRESAALINKASLVVANDSAIMHLANELDRPVVSIFGPTNDQKYGQIGKNRRIVRLNLECAPCESGECKLERRKCLDDLPATTVIEACEEVLKT